ncbi:MAG: hypothetical protein WA652_17875 [Xanthobacteraceae bacterium]
MALVSIYPTALIAQQSPIAIYTNGDAAVTGFSGASPPAQIAPGVDPNQETFIDLGGPSLRIFDLQHMDGPAQAQFVGASKPFTVTAASVGQVFGVTFDGNSPPNIYVAAASVYGLPIIAPGPDGQPQHIQIGAPNATFMPGLWGPQGGPGSIWRIDGTTGKVSLFATVTDHGRANSGAALGGLAYDPDSKSLYVADRETGMVLRFGLNGSELGSYDHGVTGRAAQGLPPAPWTSQPPIDVTSPRFDSSQPATWNYAAPQRRVFGLAVYQHRLYYAVADSLQIWSVGLNADGSFGNDAVIELAVPPSSGPTEISKITFDEQGRMYLADRAAPTGAFDFEALAVPAIGRVLRYAVITTTPDGRRIWQQQPEDYAIGFPPGLHNGDGGVAIGYDYDTRGEIVLGSCGGFMWTTGEDLRQSSDPALAARLGQTGPLDVNGLQGNGTWRIRRDDEPPLYSYFIDYNDAFDDPAERGHLGDVAIERLCTPAQRATLMPIPAIGVPPHIAPGHGPPQDGRPPGTPPPNTPPGGCPPGQTRRAGTSECGSCPRPGIQINGMCCSVTQLAATAACSNSSCPSGQTPIGPSNFCCNSSKVYTSASGAPACCSGTLVNGKCSPPTPPKPPTSTCQNGYVPIGSACCLASKMTSTGACCPAGQAPSGPGKNECKPIVLVPIGPQCCTSGIPTASGKCCPPANVTTSGVCCAGPVDPKNRKACRTLIPLAACASGYTKMPDGSCCNNRFVGADGNSCNVGQQPCPSGEFRDERGACVAIPSASCAPGQFRTTAGACLPIPSTACPEGQERDREGKCGAIPGGTCPTGEMRDREGRCVPEPRASCPPGEIRNGEGGCVPERPEPCPPGETRSRSGACVRTGPPPRVIAPGRPLGRPLGPLPPPRMFAPRRPLL